MCHLVILPIVHIIICLQETTSRVFEEIKKKNKLFKNFKTFGGNTEGDAPFQRIYPLIIYDKNITVENYNESLLYKMEKWRQTKCKFRINNIANVLRIRLRC